MLCRGCSFPVTPCRLHYWTGYDFWDKGIELNMNEFVVGSRGRLRSQFVCSRLVCPNSLAPTPRPHLHTHPGLRGGAPVGSIPYSTWHLAPGLTLAYDVLLPAIPRLLL